LTRQAEFAQPGEFAGAADRIDGGIQPQRDQQSGVDGGMAGRAFAGFNRIAQRAEVETGDEGVHQTDLMVGWQPGIQRPRRQDHLVAIRTAQSRSATRGGGGRALFGKIGEKR
jgi:hypothetical protein